MPKKKISPYYIVGGAFLAVIIIACILSLLGVGPSPIKTNSADKLLPPSASHLMGTDNMGRDLFARVLSASKYTLLISVAGVSVALVLGTIAGMLAGYFGGIWDRIIMLLGNSIMCFPGILLALMAVAVWGPSLFNVIWALGLVFAPTFARVYRTEVIKIKERDYILNAKILGVKPLRIIAVHIFPNAFTQIIPAVVIGLANMTLSESAMSYIGLGVQPPKASYGKILSDAQSYISTAPWLIIFPSLMLVIYILGLYFISEGIRGDR